MKRIVLCADDYGQVANISQGILTLIKMQRISAVSCLVTGADWYKQAVWLKEYQNQVDIGLHFNLTEGHALSAAYRKIHGTKFKSVMQLLAQSCLRGLKSAAIEAELEAQLEAFTHALGFMPHHLDGHQHVHQFPIVRDVMMRVYHRHLRKARTYIRLVKEKMAWSHSFKKAIIHFSGSNALQQLLIHHNVPHNASFAGIYHFKKYHHCYRKLFQSFLQRMENGGIIMCHPGLPGSSSKEDGIAEARVSEYSYFLSKEFLADCRQAGVEISRFV